MGRVFSVTRGTRQGSILSPSLFNIFIDDLLIQLSNQREGICIGNEHINSFAYADDVSLMCSTAPGLQKLINVCCCYAKQWRFKFGFAKTKCIYFGDHRLKKEPAWFIDGQQIENVNELEILGVIFSRHNDSHVNKRMDKCKRAFYNLRDSGMCYPGCSSDVKAYLWNTICQPVLMYGCDCVFIPKKSLSAMETCQGNLVKKSLGLNKRCRSTALMESLCVRRVDRKIVENNASLLKRIMSVSSSARDLTSHFLSLYVCNGTLIPGTLIDRVVQNGLSPTRCIFNSMNVLFNNSRSVSSGVVDSLRSLLMHSNFIKPYSEEHILTYLLLRSF